MSFAWAKPYEPKRPFMRWLDERLPLPRLAYGAVGGGYPVPRNLNYLWNFGFLAGLFLTIQIVTGIVLALDVLVMSASAGLYAEAVAKYVAALAPSGLSLKVYDCYRPERAVRVVVQ